MAKVLGFNPPNESYVELHDTIRLQRSLIEELIKLNEGYEGEVKRLVGEYDKLYEMYLSVVKELQKVNPNAAGYPKYVEFKDFSK
jgi:hypothetical protein